MKKALLVFALAAALSACHDSTPPQPQGYAFTQPAAVAHAPQVQAPAPVTVVNQAPAANNGDGMLTGALLGGAVGYMAGSANRQPAYHDYAPRTTYVDRRPIIVKQTKNVYVKQVVQAPKAAPAPTPVAPRLSLSKSSNSGSSFGGFSRRK